MDKWTFIERLEYAASYDEIISSAYALSTWSKTATPPELFEFVNSKALKSFVLRALQCSNEEFEKVRAPLLQLIR